MAIRSEDKPLYQPWNEDDFSGDLLVSAMTPVQRWMYRTLLQRAFFYSTRPDLPNDPKVLWQLAGCENRKQWDDNADPVVAMFQVEDIGGQSVLYQKRLRKDWDRYVTDRESRSERGKQGAQARWGAPEAEPEPAKVSQKELNVLRLIPQYCRSIIGLRPEREDYYKKDLKELSDAYGGTRVVNAFEQWAKKYSGDTRYPIKEFLRVADQYLSNRVREDSPLLEETCLRLYEVGGHAFTGKYKAALNLILDEASSDEVVSAFKQFASDKDDTSLKFAPRDFCEGAAKTIIAANRKRESDRLRKEKLIREGTERLQREAAEEKSTEEIIEEEL